MSRQPGTLLSEGATGRVFAYGDDAVVKILRAGIPAPWANVEAAKTRAIRDGGFRAAEVLEVATIDGAPAIVFRRLGGPTMAETMLADRSQILPLARQMAQLQRDIQSAPPPAGLPALHDCVSERIDAAVSVSHVARTSAKQILSRLGVGSVLCHGDLHPGNIVMSPDGPVPIDWFDAVVGDGLADVVRTSLLLRLPRDGEHELCHFRGATPALVSAAHDAYVIAALEHRPLDSPVERDALRDWEVVLAVARLAEPVPPSGLVAIWHDRGNANSGSPLVACFDRLSSQWSETG